MYRFLSDEIAHEGLVTLKKLLDLTLVEDRKFWLEEHIEKVMWINNIRDKYRIWTGAWFARIIVRVGVSTSFRGLH